MFKLPLATAVFAVVLTSLPCFDGRAQIIFNDAAVGNSLWSVGGNWGGGNSPTLATSDAVINNGLAAVVNNAGQRGGVITVGRDGSSGTLSITAGDLTASGNLVLSQAGGNPAGNATVNHSGGTLFANRIIVGDNPNSPITSYNVSGAAVISQVPGNPFQLGNKSNADNVKFSISGNAASITLADYSINNNALQEFVFGSSGISTVNTQNIALTNGRLSVNLSGFSFAGTQSFTLFNSLGTTLGIGETFSSVSITGNSGYTASVVYDTVNSDILLNVTAVPEPSTFGLMIGAAATLVVYRRRRRR